MLCAGCNRKKGGAREILFAVSPQFTGQEQKEQEIGNEQNDKKQDRCGQS